ncbi:MAG TPA: adenylate/guanylate cyclase domain-containing protein [Candidatus Limnocylindrales bacterium]|nr:adenylate/guanylate cyclase domain-containing protein [Candidatus Limnocylindrales bacterium]
MRDLPSGPLTILFTDIEGSTRLLAHLGDAYVGLLEDHNRLLRASFAAHRGIEVSTTGDSFFVVFREAIDAVRAATDGQRALMAHRWPDGGQVKVRMGVHSGHAVRVGDDYVGIEVHRAARIADAANGCARRRRSDGHARGRRLRTRRRTRPLDPATPMKHRSMTRSDEPARSRRPSSARRKNT